MNSREQVQGLFSAGLFLVTLTSNDDVVVHVGPPDVPLPRYGNIKSDHVLFVCAGSFHAVRPSDMLAELQGRTSFGTGSLIFYPQFGKFVVAWVGEVFECSRGVTVEVENSSPAGRRPPPLLLPWSSWAYSSGGPGVCPPSGVWVLSTPQRRRLRAGVWVGQSWRR